jgi:hypothetical protein
MREGHVFLDEGVIFYSTRSEELLKQESTSVPSINFFS